MRDAFLKLHLSVLVASFTGIFGKLITMSEGVLVWYRMLLTSILLYAFLKLIGKLRTVDKRSVYKIGFVGFLLAMHWIFFYGSIKASNVSIGVICFSTTGFFTALFEPMIDRKRFSWMEIGLSIIALLGVLFIFQFDDRYRLGIGLGIISSALCALYTSTNKHVSRSFPSGTVLFYTIVGGFVGLTALMPIYFWFFPQEILIPDATNLLYLLLFVVVCTIGLYLLQIQVLKKVSAFTVNLTYNLEPVYSIVWAILLFGESSELNYSFYIGLGLIAFSVALQSVYIVRTHKQNKQPIINK